jgi:hypothetical protein
MLLLTAAFIELCLILIVRSGDLLQHTAAYLVFYFAAFAACVFSYNRFRALSQRALVLVLLLAALFRITLLFAPPTLSGDSYRYLWDGTMTAHEINPYQYEPQNPALQRFQNSQAFRIMNSQAFLTVYPPTSQYLFFLAYKLFGENPIGLKIIFSTLDFAAVIMVYLLLKEFALPLEGLFLYAWNPLPIVEFSGSGHSDSGMLFFLLLSIYLLRKRRVASSMVSLALAIWSKLVPLICIPFYLKKASWRSLAILLLALVVLFLPFLDLQVLKTSARSVEKLYYRVLAFNASLHYLICFIGKTYFDADLNQWTGPVLRTIFFIFAIFLFFYRKMKDELDLMRVTFYLMFAALLLATQVHPWYVTWALIFIPFFPKPSILYLSGAVALSYLTYAVVPWRERTWVLLVEYVPVYALLALEVIRFRHEGTKTQSIASFVSSCLRG